MSGYNKIGVQAYVNGQGEAGKVKPPLHSDRSIPNDLMTCLSKEVRTSLNYALGFQAEVFLKSRDGYEVFCTLESVLEEAYRVGYDTCLNKELRVSKERTNALTAGILTSLLKPSE